MSDRRLQETAAWFEDTVSLWRMAPVIYIPEVIDAATECLVAGMDSPSLRELAGASSRESQFVLEPLIVDTLDELGLSGLLDTDVQVRALAVLGRDVGDTEALTTRRTSG